MVGKPSCTGELVSHKQWELQHPSAINFSISPCTPKGAITCLYTLSQVASSDKHRSYFHPHSQAQSKSLICATSVVVPTPTCVKKKEKKTTHTQRVLQMHTESFSLPQHWWRRHATCCHRRFASRTLDGLGKASAIARNRML